MFCCTCIELLIFQIFQFKEGDIRPVNDDILIAKLRPGQVILLSYIFYVTKSLKTITPVKLLSNV